MRVPQCLSTQTVPGPWLTTSCCLVALPCNHSVPPSALLWGSLLCYIQGQGWAELAFCLVCGMGTAHLGPELGRGGHVSSQPYHMTWCCA